MSISLKELIKDTNFSSLSSEVQGNLMTLLERVNKVREAYGKPMTITSGLRTKEDQIRVYKSKGITDLAKIPMGSMHLKGAAVDIADSDGKVKEWCKNNIPLLESLGLWCEDFSATPTWVHFQVFPPKSGARFFKP